MPMLPPDNYLFAEYPPSLQQLCERIHELTGNAVSVVPATDGSPYQYRKGCVAFDAVPDQMLEIWEYPPQFELPQPTKAFEADDESCHVPFEMRQCLEHPSDRWTLILSGPKLNMRRLSIATRIALEDFGGESNDPIDDGERQQVTTPRSENRLRLDYQRSRIGFFVLFALIVSTIFVISIGALLVFVLCFPFLFIGTCICRLREDWRSTA